MSDVFDNEGFEGVQEMLERILAAGSKRYAVQMNQDTRAYAWNRRHRAHEEWNGWIPATPLTRALRACDDLILETLTNEGDRIRFDKLGVLPE